MFWFKGLLEEWPQSPSLLPFAFIDVYKCKMQLPRLSVDVSRTIYMGGLQMT